MKYTYKIIDRAIASTAIGNELNELGNNGWHMITALLISATYGDKKIRYIFKKIIK